MDGTDRNLNPFDATTAMSSTVIFLVGASASGKSTLAEHLQERLRGTFLAMELDSFIDMLPGDPFDQNETDFERTERGYHGAIAAAAEAGNNVIEDHYRADLDPRLLAGFDVLMVGVRCPLDELERREADRPPELRGFARSQYDGVHEGNEYDVEVNTAESSPEECARRVAAQCRKTASSG